LLILKSARQQFSSKNSSRKEVKTMTYHKPEIRELGPAMTAIQAGLMKGTDVPDSNDHQPSIDAYRNDE
jgi:hypothetical protein